MKNKIAGILTVVLLFTGRNLIADEGMWLPILLNKGTEADMIRLGMKVSAEDIYNVNKPSMKDAVVLFGGGCTAEIISEQGLILTNHHCGYAAIQAHSSIENDYLTKGFWAMSQKEELPNPGLSASILVRMEDVTSRVLKDVTDGMNPEQKNALIEFQISLIEKEAAKNNKYEVMVEPFYYGNQYILVVYEVFNDIRLVGAPPSSIGKFGGDTDNWVWPRHTGDFSLFRIYTDKNNAAADYSETNIPYKPRYSFSISLKGVKPGDFTFVFGYPGQTQEYLYSEAVNRIANFENPANIKMRGLRLAVIKKYMEQNDTVRLQYSSKYFSIENYYKKMIGESNGVKRTDIIRDKQMLEKEFNLWANADDARKAKYGSLMSDFQKTYQEIAPYNLAVEYLYEGGLGIEFVRFAYAFDKLAELSKGKKVNDEQINKYIERLQAYTESFYKNYNPSIDKEVMAGLLKIYTEGLPDEYIPAQILDAKKAYKGDFQKYTASLFATSILLNKQKTEALLATYKPSESKEIINDPAYKLAKSIYSTYFDKFSSKVDELQARLDELYALYLQGLMEMQPDRRFYPDANSTLRVSYGQVMGFKPKDAVEYNYFTTLQGVLDKEDPEVYDYTVDEKLKKLYNDKDYGLYADADGSMHVAFVASNHTTGGNSGSPVLNAHGQLIGINFDRVWEGTMSDIVYDPEICRNISLDIRYCLFIIDKFAGAGHLVNEMKLVK